MENAVLDPEYQRRVGLHALLSCGGYKTLVEELKNLQIGVESQLESQMHESIDQAKLAKLNFQLGKKKAYEIVFEVLDSFKEELEDHDNSPSQA